MLHSIPAPAGKSYLSKQTFSAALEQKGNFFVMLRKSSFKTMLIPEAKNPFLPYLQLVLLRIVRADIFNVETCIKAILYKSSTN